MLGNRVKALSTGGAPTSPAVLAFMRDCFKHTIVGVGYVKIKRVVGVDFFTGGYRGGKYWRQ